MGLAGGLALASRRRSSSAPPPQNDGEPNDDLYLAYRSAVELAQFNAGFLARVSHEIRAPLNGLIGTHQLILAGLCESEAEEREFLENAHTSALKLVEMLDEILAVSRTEYGKIQIQIQPVRLKKVFDQVYTLMHLQAENRNFKLEVAFPDPELQVLADVPRLRQILAKSVSLAIDSMEEGKIVLHSATEGDRVSIYLDAPFSPELWHESVDRLTSPLNPENELQLNPKLSPGLNLTLIRRLVEVMDGRLERVSLPEADDPKWVRLRCSLPKIKESV